MTAGSIRIRNDHKAYKLDERLIKGIAFRVLKILRRANSIDLEIVFLDDRSIRPLNREFRNRDRSTDVLSFKLDRTEFGKKLSLGEVFISLDKALANSAVYGKTFDEEIALYVIHGVLHLFGYDDESPAEKRRMSKKEEKVLRSICKTEALSIVSMRQ